MRLMTMSGLSIFPIVVPLLQLAILADAIWSQFVDGLLHLSLHILIHIQHFCCFKSML